jgi:hypothetical protein
MTALEKLENELIAAGASFECDYWPGAGAGWHINVFRTDSDTLDVDIIATGDGPSIEAAIVDCLAKMGAL